MLSIRARLVIGLIKRRHLFKFKLKPEVVDETFSVANFRNDIDKVSVRIKIPKDITTQKISVSGINAEWIIPENPFDDKVLLYIHGGGFISGSCLTHRMHVAKFARECKIRSLVFDYRLSPEYPFPAAPQDCLTVYKWLIENGYLPENIIIGGESAGATLTLSLLLAIKESKMSLPKAAFVVSPVTDLTCGAASFTYNAKNDVAPFGSWKIWTEYYISGSNPLDPLLSPLHGDLHNFPPLYICVGTHEIHLDDCINLYKKAKHQGVAVTIKKWDKMIHAFPLLTPLFPEAKRAFFDICEFVKSELKG